VLDDRSASLSTHHQLMGGDVESEETGRYGMGKPGRMVLKDSRAEGTPLGVVLPGIPVPDI
jgi:hypothetical protein